MEEKIKKRAAEIQIILDSYIAEWNAGSDHNIGLIENAGLKVATTYFDIHNMVVKPYLQEGAKSSKYKVAAVTEFACLYVKPITNSTMKIYQRREQNALFATTAALNLLLNISVQSINSINNTEYDRIKPPLYDHIKWLTNFNTNNKNYAFLPTYLNSNFWYLLGSILIPKEATIQVNS